MVGSNGMTAESTQSPPVSIEHALVARACRGDARAFRRIFDRHAPAVRRFLSDLLQDSASADETTQETFVRAHRSMSTLRDDTRLGPWLFGIARNVFRERSRARKRQQQHSEFRDDMVPAPEDSARFEVPSPRDLLLRQESDAMLREALAKLSPERRAALVLRLDHQLGYPEIAQVMSWSQNKVKNEIHRARVQLRELLKHYLRGVS